MCGNSSEFASCKPLDSDGTDDLLFSMINKYINGDSVSEMKLAFLAYNEEDWMTNPKDYDGQPCLYYKENDVEYILSLIHI